MRASSLLAAGVALALSSCSSAPREKVVYRTVTVPVAVDCVPSELAPRDPALDALTPPALALLPGPVALKALAADWLLQRQRRLELEAVVEGCRKEEAPPT